MIDSRLLYIIHVLLNYELRMCRIKACSGVRSTRLVQSAQPHYNQAFIFLVVDF